MARLALADYLPAKLEYGWDPAAGGYRHPFAVDIQGFALWEASRWRENELLERLADRFVIRCIYEVFWSAQHADSSFNRLYERNPWNRHSRASSVGIGPFLYVVVEDPDGLYSYTTNVSGRVEISNQKVSAIKPQLRELVRDGGFAYKVHSSNGLAEFIRDAALLFGPDELNSLLAYLDNQHTDNGLGHRPSLDGMTGVDFTWRPWKRDMVGAGGWNDIDELFATATMTQRLVILRSVRDARRPIPRSEGDIDILCDRSDAMASHLLANPSFFGRHTSHAYTRVGKAEVHIDLREVGDGDIDPVWQDRMLADPDIDCAPFLTPRNDHQFFYLAYHSALHKGTIKSVHQSTLSEVGLQIGMGKLSITSGNEPSDDLHRAIRGFLDSNHFRITKPNWADVRLHKEGVSRVGRDLVARSARSDLRSRLFRATDLTRRLLRRLPVLGPLLATIRSVFRRASA